MRLYSSYPWVIFNCNFFHHGSTYKRRTYRGPPVVGKHGDAFWQSSPCDLPPTALAPLRPHGGRNRKSPPCWDNKRLGLYVLHNIVDLVGCCRFFPPKLLCKPRYGAFQLFAKTPRDDPTEYPTHQHRCLGMVSANKRTSQTNNNVAAAEVCASSNRYTFQRLAPPSTSLYRERRSEVQTGPMAYAIATDQRLLQIRGL